MVRARLDEPSTDALALLKAEGRTESEAVRTALVEAARRRLRRSELRAEAERVGRDPADRAEARAIMEDMDALRAPWPSD